MKRKLEAVLAAIKVWRTPCTKKTAKRLLKHFRPHKHLPKLGSERLLCGEWGDGLALENTAGVFFIRDDSKPVHA